MSQQGFNQILLLGRLAAEPELRRTGTGVALCTLRLAVDETRRPPEGGDPVRETLYVDAIATGPQAESCNRWLASGDRVFVQGRLNRREWTGRDGRQHSSYRVLASRVQFLDPPKTGSGADAPGAPFVPAPAPRPPSGDLPF